MNEPGLLRVFEIWRDISALERHKHAPHVAQWRSLWPELGIHDRNLRTFAVDAEAAF
jgi:quinol monooxygenase YgiN